MPETEEVRPPGPCIESPDWGDVQKLATSVLRLLGGPRGAADKLDGRSFYTLCILESLNLDDEKAAAPLLGTRWLT